MSQENQSLFPIEEPKEVIPSPPKEDRIEKELKLISHSQYFYYWPLWMISLIFAALTAYRGQTIPIHVPNVGKITTKIIGSPSLGLAYLIVFATVILFTSVNIRGVWAALVAAVLIILSLVFYVFELWAPILKAIGSVNFFINYDFYLWMGIILFIIWVLVVYIYDRRHYLVFGPTQFTVVEEVGDGEKNFDAVGIVFEKQRDNFFQHWLLGFGSGDLKIITSGGQRHEIYFPNVLFISSKLDDLHRIRERRGR